MFCFCCSQVAHIFYCRFNCIFQLVTTHTGTCTHACSKTNTHFHKKRQEECLTHLQAPLILYTITYRCTGRHPHHSCLKLYVMTSPPQSALSLVLWGHRMLIENRKLVFPHKFQRAVIANMSQQKYDPKCCPDHSFSCCIRVIEKKPWITMNCLCSFV